MTVLCEEEGQLAPRIDALDELHRTLARFWQQVEARVSGSEPAISESVRVRFETAIAEIGANILEHAIHPNQQEPVFLWLCLESDRLIGQFRDHGKPLQISGPVPHPFDERGRGLQIIEAIADEVTYQRNEAGINHWYIMLRLD